MNLEDYNKYYIQGSDHYLIPKDVFKALFNEMINWKEESKKQKEVIDNATNKILSHELTKDKIVQQDCLTHCYGIPIGDIPKLITQQKEFMKWLESVKFIGIIPIKMVCDKYKEIIGVKDGKK